MDIRELIEKSIQKQEVNGKTVLMTTVNPRMHEAFVLSCIAYDFKAMQKAA